jgi:hypothetical protein
VLAADLNKTPSIDRLCTPFRPIEERWQAGSVAPVQPRGVGVHVVLQPWGVHEASSCSFSRLTFAGISLRACLRTTSGTSSFPIP